MKPLVIDTYDFEELITYVDNTEVLRLLIDDLIDSPFFLSRMYRFGRALFILIMKRGSGV